MSIRRRPHPGFAALWVGWYANILGALALPEDPVYGLGVLLLFLPIEIAGVVLRWNFRDTLSEIVTWTWKKLSKDTSRAMRGWNAGFVVIIWTIDHLLYRTVVHHSGSEPLGWVVFVGVFMWLYDHWSDPVTHG